MAARPDDGATLLDSIEDASFDPEPPGQAPPAAALVGQPPRRVPLAGRVRPAARRPRLLGPRRPARPRHAGHHHPRLPGRRLLARRHARVARPDGLRRPLVGHPGRTSTAPTAPSTGSTRGSADLRARPGDKVALIGHSPRRALREGARRTAAPTASRRSSRSARASTPRSTSALPPRRGRRGAHLPRGRPTAAARQRLLHRPVRLPVHARLRGRVPGRRAAHLDLLARRRRRALAGLRGALRRQRRGDRQPRRAGLQPQGLPRAGRALAAANAPSNPSARPPCRPR